MKNLNDNDMMKRCLDLARRGLGSVSPNPMVGCVIVKNGRIVGEGFHKKFGGQHAEIDALRKAGAKAKGATLFVNLEPCVHYGKTPPCVDEIIDSGISKVVIASQDPNPLMSGRGIRKLRKAGIKLKVGVLKEESIELNEKFFKLMRTGLPFVSVKLAQTSDGKIADVAGRSQWITSTEARKKAHQLRSEHDAVLVGAMTVMKDNPALTVRLVPGNNPVRIVLDGRLIISPSRSIFNTKIAPTWILTSSQTIRTKFKKVHELVSKGVRVIGISSSYKFNARSILKILAAEGVSSVMVEGGSRTAATFIQNNCADKLYLFIAPQILGGGLDAFHFDHPLRLNGSIKLKIVDNKLTGNDLLIEALFNKK
jgi:diaminohydroxyphosphoribosylaminopyrimidine deaminase / 5-amino-6-(5-phosphoribosylamino)uracil reductase